MPNIPLDKELYERVREHVYSKIPKHSAYRSGILVKLYKKLGGRYKHVGNERGIDAYPLKRWFAEKWKDVSPKSKKNIPHYPLYRPTRRVSKKTPLTLQEIPNRNISEQYKRKQKLRHSTLPHFKRKNKRNSV